MAQPPVDWRKNAKKSGTLEETEHAAMAGFVRGHAALHCLMPFWQQWSCSALKPGMLCPAKAAPGIC
jgi:hypothetical protein